MALQIRRFQAGGDEKHAIGSNWRELTHGPAMRNSKTKAMTGKRAQGLRGGDKQQRSLRDLRSGAYDDAGETEAFHKKEGKRTKHQRAQPGADVRQGTTKHDPSTARPSDLPEGLRRPQQGPYDKLTGRAAKRS
jgi:hypothetical protein